MNASRGIRSVAVCMIDRVGACNTQSQKADPGALACAEDSARVNDWRTSAANVFLRKYTHAGNLISMYICIQKDDSKSSLILDLLDVVGRKRDAGPPRRFLLRIRKPTQYINLPITCVYTFHAS